jgi:imidazoleglycerol phosphate synthase glutamine amidotransferase subunit HisH
MHVCRSCSENTDVCHDGCITNSCNTRHLKRLEDGAGMCPQIGWTHVKISHYYYRVHTLHITICSYFVISHIFIFGLLDVEKKDVMILGDVASSSPSDSVEHPKTFNFRYYISYAFDTR